MQNDGLFETVREFPDPEAETIYHSLVGIDHNKTHLAKEASVILDPEAVEAWSNQHYNKEIALLKTLKQRPPLFIFSGDVGTGKSALAETFADQIARQHKLSVSLYKLSLSARGSGMVGEMTKLVTEAFKTITDEARKRTNGRSGIVLLIDEADALAQSREGQQMHHEDKAGVNALIRGIDSLQGLPTPVLVVMCTNRPGAIDPAVKRRSAFRFEFSRPTLSSCTTLLQTNLSDIGLSPEQIQEIAQMCVEHEVTGYGYTYSDITHRLLPTILLEAIPDKPISIELIVETIKSVTPTEPFAEEAK